MIMPVYVPPKQEIAHKPAVAPVPDEFLEYRNPYDDYCLPSFVGDLGAGYQRPCLDSDGPKTELEELIIRFTEMLPNILHHIDVLVEGENYVEIRLMPGVSPADINLVLTYKHVMEALLRASKNTEMSMDDLQAYVNHGEVPLDSNLRPVYQKLTDASIKINESWQKGEEFRLLDQSDYDYLMWLVNYGYFQGGNGDLEGLRECGIDNVLGYRMSSCSAAQFLGIVAVGDRELEDLPTGLSIGDLINGALGFSIVFALSLFFYLKTHPENNTKDK